jgi:hypothetical protein
VQEPERRAAGTRSLAEIHDARRAQHSLQRVALEPLVEQVRDRHRDDNAQQILYSLPSDPVKAESEPGIARQIAEVPAQGIGRRLQVQRFEHARQTPIRSQNRGQRSASRALNFRIASTDRPTSRQRSNRPPPGSGADAQGSGQTESTAPGSPAARRTSKAIEPISGSSLRGAPQLSTMTCSPARASM